MGADEGIKEGGFSDRLLLSTPFHKWSPLYWRLPAAKNSDSTHITSSKLSSHLPYTTLCEFEHESATFRNSSFKRCENQNSFDWSNFHSISIPSKVLQICVLCILWPLPADLSTIQIWAPQQTWLISRRLSPRIRRRAWSIYTHSYHSQYYLHIPNDPTDDCNTDIIDDVNFFFTSPDWRKILLRQTCLTAICQSVSVRRDFEAEIRDQIPNCSQIWSKITAGSKGSLT